MHGVPRDRRNRYSFSMDKYDGVLYCSRLPLTLTRSVSEVAKSLPRLRFGLIWIVTTSTASSIARSGQDEILSYSCDSCDSWLGVRRSRPG